MISINEQIIQIAKIFIGQEEIRGNLGFKKSSLEILDRYKKIFGIDMALSFEEMMVDIGWRKKEAWCAYYGELIWKLSYSLHNSLIIPELDRLFSASAVQTLNNFEQEGWPIHRGLTPKPGSIVIWKHYNNGIPSWSGHEGIFVMNTGYNKLSSIDGNTNNDRSREGYEVEEKTRLYNYKSKHGLVLQGFIEPKEP